MLNLSTYDQAELLDSLQQVIELHIVYIYQIWSKPTAQLIVIVIYTVFFVKKKSFLNHECVSSPR